MAVTFPVESSYVILFDDKSAVQSLDFSWHVVMGHSANLPALVSVIS